jgi:hypothetical protein
MYGNSYLGGYAADRLGVRENNTGNGGKHTKKRVKIKAQKESYEVFGLQRETYVKVVTRPAHN